MKNIILTSLIPFPTTLTPSASLTIHEQTN